MKQISRILALLLVAVFMFSMVSCNKDDANKTDNNASDTTAEEKKELTAEEYENLFSASEVKFTAITENGLSADVNLSMTVARGGSTVKMDCAAMCDALVEDGVIKQASIQFDTSTLGVKNSQKYYIEGTKLYTASEMGKYVSELTDGELKIEDLFSQFIGDTENGDETAEEVDKLTKALEDYLTENLKPEYSNPEKDVYVAKITVTSQNIMDIVKLAIDNMPDFVTNGDEEGDGSVSVLPADINSVYEQLEKIKFDDIVLTCTLNNAENSFKAELEAKLSVDPSLITDTSDSDFASTDPADVSLSLDVTVSKLGEKVTVTAPSDLDSYEEAPDEDEIATAIIDALYDEEGNMLQGEELEAAYAALVEIYGQDVVDAVIDYINGQNEVLNAVINSMYDEEGNPLDDATIAEAYTALVDLYGQELVDAALDYIVSLSSEAA